jgi:hypothetical protein
VLQQGFFAESAGVRVLVLAGISNIPASLAVPRARIWHSFAFGAFPVGVAVRRAPDPGPVRGDRDELFDLFCTFPRRLSTGRRVRFP